MVHHPSASSPHSQPTAPLRSLPDYPSTMKSQEHFHRRQLKVQGDLRPPFDEHGEDFPEMAAGNVDFNALGLKNVWRHPSDLASRAAPLVPRATTEKKWLDPPIRTPPRQRHRGLVKRAKYEAWRGWVWFAGSFGIAVMEPWESVLSITVYVSLLVLLALFLVRLPGTLGAAASRLTFYLTGNELGAASSLAVEGALRIAAEAGGRAGATAQAGLKSVVSAAAATAQHSS